MSARLSARVQPSASRNEVAVFEGDLLRIRVTAPPERGKATEAAIEVLAKALGLAKGRITLMSGAASRQKVLSIAGLDLAEVKRRLSGAL